MTWAQRLGYLLEVLECGEQAAALRAYVSQSARDTVALVPGAARDNARVDRNWKLVINTEVEPEF